MKLFRTFWSRTMVYPAVLVLLLAGLACGASEEPESAPAQAPAQPAAQQQEPAQQPAAALAQAQPAQQASQAPAAAPSGGGAASSSSAPEPVMAPTPTVAPEQARAEPEVVAAVDDAPYGILRVANKDLGPPQFLPKNMAVPQATYVSPVIFDALWRMSPERVLQNDLLEDWSLSEDGTTWRLQLKEGIPYHKGYGTANMHDLMWVVNQIMLEEARHPGKTNMRRIFQRDETETTITFIDDLTIEINTGTHRAFDFIWRFQQFGANNFIPLASQAYADEVGEEQATLEGIGTGPWQFVEFRTNERFISEAVPDHWHKTPYFQELHYFQITEESTRIANFLAGELDTMQVSLGSIPNLTDAEGVKFMRFAGALELHMTLHGQLYVDREGIPERDNSLPWNSVSDDINSPEWQRARDVRKAMIISIDRESIVDNVLDGEGHANNPYWRWTGYEQFFDEEMRNTEVEYDVERARKLLADAGYADGFEVDMALTQRSYPGTPKVGEAVCVMWEEINIRCKQHRMPMTAFRPHFVNRTWKGYNTHDNSPSDEPLNAYSHGISSKGLIMRGMEHPWLDAQVEAMFNEPNFEKRMEIQRDTAKWLFAQAVHIPIASINVVWPVGAEIDLWNFGCCARDIASNLEFVPHRDQLDGEVYPK
ncbi:MAG: ABC transporter substrate-binding protein [Chloroflexota bacterium]|nr:ABC transporter substrate-binding protein [Chloroflexota bacterium]